MAAPGMQPIVFAVSLQRDDYVEDQETRRLWEVRHIGVSLLLLCLFFGEKFFDNVSHLKTTAD